MSHLGDDQQIPEEEHMQPTNRPIGVGVQLHQSAVVDKRLLAQVHIKVGQSLGDRCNRSLILQFLFSLTYINPSHTIYTHLTNLNLHTTLLLGYLIALLIGQTLVVQQRQSVSLFLQNM